MSKLTMNSVVLACAFLAVAVVNAPTVSAVSLTDFTGAWTFDDGTANDVSGNGNNLVAGFGAPTFGANVPSNNGWTADGLGGQAFNANGPRLDTPGGIYSGGDFTMTLAARGANPGSNISFGTILASNRFQMHQDNNRVDVRNVGTGNHGGPAGEYSNNDWYLMTLRYNSTSGLVEKFLTTNTGLLDASPGTFNVGSSYQSITTFGFGRDGLSGIGGADALNGSSQIDFAVFQDGFLTNTELQDLYTAFDQGFAGVPEPTTALFCLAAVGIAGLCRRRNHAS